MVEKPTPRVVVLSERLRAIFGSRAAIYAVIRRHKKQTYAILNRTPEHITAIKREKSTN